MTGSEKSCIFFFSSVIFSLKIKEYEGGRGVDIFDYDADKNNLRLKEKLNPF